jgi:predicted RNA-binding protein with PUA-like domain
MPSDRDGWNAERREHRRWSSVKINSVTNPETMTDLTKSKTKRGMKVKMFLIKSKNHLKMFL